MNEFDQKAPDWDKNQMHIERSSAISKAIEKTIPLGADMEGFEYGCGTGLLSFNLADKLHSIRMADSSEGMFAELKVKILERGIQNMHPVMLDLEKEAAAGYQTDIIFTQMVLHHIGEIELVLERFYSMLRPGGYVCIADLYAEDGSFHGAGFSGHNGFDPDVLKTQLEKTGFVQVRYDECYQIKKGEKIYPIFLMTAKKY